MAETDKDDLISLIEDDDLEAEIPGILPLMPVRDVVVFTDMVLPLFVGREKSVRAVQEKDSCFWQPRWTPPSNTPIRMKFSLPVR